MTYESQILPILLYTFNGKPSYSINYSHHTSQAYNLYLTILYCHDLIIFLKNNIYQLGINKVLMWFNQSYDPWIKENYYIII